MFPRCFNPLQKKLHKKVGRENLRLVFDSISEVFSVNLETYICNTCRLQVQKSLHDSTPSSINTNSFEKMEIEETEVLPEAVEEMEFDVVEESIENENDDLQNLKDEVNRKESISKLNEILSILQLSSIKVSSDLRTKTEQLKKINEIKETFDMLLKKVFKFIEADKFQNDVEELINEIKEKLNSKPKKSDAVKLLTMLPKTWEVRKIVRIFDVPYSLARKAVNLHVSNGIGSSPNSRPGKTLPNETVTLVRNFYYDDEVSRQLLGKKYCKSVKLNGTKKLIQKRIILGNLKEVYSCFKEKYPDLKIGFSKFAELRPKECVFAGSSGTHVICVCKKYENTKLLIEASNLDKLTANDEKLQFLTSYKTMLSAMICNLSTSSCCLGLC